MVMKTITIKKNVGRHVNRNMGLKAIFKHKNIKII